MKSVNEISLSVFAGFQLPHIPRIYDLLIKTSNIIAIILICVIDLDVYTALLQYFFIQYLISLLLMGYFIKYYDVSVIDLFKKVSQMNILWVKSAFDTLKKTTPFLIISIPQSFIQTMDNFIVLNYQTSDVSVSFVFYLKVYSIMFITQNIIFPIYYPVWSKYINELNFNALKKSFIKTNLLMVLLNLIVTIMLIYFGELIFKIWIHHDIQMLPSIDVLLLSLSFGFMMFKGSIFFINNSIGVKYKVVASYWIEFLLHLFFGILLVKLYGLSGLIVASLLSTVVGIILVGKHVLKQLEKMHIMI